MADPFSYHPYQDMKQVKPEYYTCDICDRRIPSKHKQSHEAGKPHRLIKDAITRGTKAAGFDDAVVEDEPKPLVLDGTECHNCKKKGHRAADCTNPKYDDRPCHNCKKIGHQSRDCPNPRVDDRECFNCKQTGHQKMDCPNPRVMVCHNCDETGHMRNECPKPRKPRDPATVTCNNCQQLGHFARGCTNEKVEQDAGGFSGDFGGGGDFGGTSTGFGGAPEPPATAEFEGATGGFDAW